MGAYETLCFCFSSCNKKLKIVHTFMIMFEERLRYIFPYVTALATTDHLRVKQSEPYGEILISRGSKMWRGLKQWQVDEG